MATLQRLYWRTSWWVLDKGYKAEFEEEQRWFCVRASSTERKKGADGRGDRHKKKKVY